MLKASWENSSSWAEGSPASAARIASGRSGATHVGGRIDTFYNFNQRLPGQGPNFFANGEYVGLHGEYVSSEHAEMIGLANRYGLQLDIASANQTTLAYPPGTADVYWFNGAYYTQALAPLRAWNR